MFEIPTTESILASALRMPSVGKKKKAHPELDPAEEKSLLSDVLSSGASGLQYLGETLDKPGRAVRGLLAGKPKELANLIPFSDTMGLTDPSESVSGRDLLEKAGALDKNQPGLDWGDVAGFGVELATDPLSYLTMGASAVGKAGKVAKGLGISAKGAAKYKTLGQHLAAATPEILKAAENAAVKHGSTLAELSGEKLGGAFGLTTGPLGLLGMHGTHVPKFAQSSTAEAAMKGLRELPGKAARMLPGGEHLVSGAKNLKAFGTGLFDYEAQGKFNPLAQEMAIQGTRAHEKLKPRLMFDYLTHDDELSKLISDFHAEHGTQVLPGGSAADTLKKSGEIVRRAVQHYGETQGKPGGFEAVMSHLKVSPDIEGRASAIGKALSETQKMDAHLYMKQGGDMRMLQESEDFAHLARRGAEKKALNPLKARREATRYIPAQFQEQMLHDPSLIYADAGKVNRVEPHILKQRLLDHPTYAKMIEEAAAASGKPVKKVAGEVADRLYGKGSKYLTSGDPLYSDEVLKNHLQFRKALGLKIANQDAIHALFQKNLTNGGESTVRLSQAFRDVGMNGSRAVQHMAEQMGMDPKALSAMRVGEDVAAAAGSLLKKSSHPEWLDNIGSAIDKMTEGFKKHVTLPFPGFAARNLSSGQWMNISDPSMASIQQLNKYRQRFNDALGILKNPGQHSDFLREMFAHDVITPDLQALGVELGWGFGGKGLPNPLTGKGVIQNVTEGFAGAREAGQKWPKGLKTVGTAVNTPAAIGGKVNQQVEFLNRATEYLHLRKDLGWTPEAASAKVRQLQVDYSQMSPFERTVMKRMVPFYSWQRKIVPVMLQQIAERPGGVTAQTVRASNTGRSKDEFVPPYVGEGMSVNLGGDKYLSGLGLPTDQLSDLFVNGPTALGTAKRTGQKALSQLNPLLKGPLEIASGQNFFTGRPIEESFPYPTNSVLGNQIIHNSPFSRLTTTARQIGDERKDWKSKAANLLMGLRITDVSGGLDKQQRMAEGKMIAEMLKESPEIASSTDVYPKKDRATGKPLTLEPETEKLYRAYLSLKKKSADEAKKRKKHPVGVQ